MLIVTMVIITEEDRDKIAMDLELIDDKAND